MIILQRAISTETLKAEGRTLYGFLPYNSPTRVAERGRTYTEVLRPGCFRAAEDVVCLFNHDPNKLLGRSASGTLRISDSPEGLRYQVDLPESALEVRELLARGDLRGSSFTAGVLPGGSKTIGDLVERTALKLVELGPVVQPFYLDSEAVLRGLFVNKETDQPTLSKRITVERLLELKTRILRQLI